MAQITVPALAERNPHVVNQTIQQLAAFTNAQQPFVDAKRDFNAVGDGNTDDTSALQQAANAAMSEGIPLFIPPTAAGYIISKSGNDPVTGLDYCLTFPKPIVLLGQPGYSILFPKPGTAATTVICLFTGTSTGSERVIVDGIMIANPATGTYDGFHALYFATLLANQLFLRPRITRNYLGTPNNGTGSSIFVNNSTANNGNGGFAYGYIGDQNLIGAGISLNGAGDSIRIEQNILTKLGSNANNNVAIFANLITNAGNLQITGNNQGYDAGAVQIDYADTFTISDNEFEHANITNTNPVILIGNTATRVPGGSVVNNELTVLGGSANQPLCLKIDRADEIHFDGNTFQPYTGAYVPVLITANAGSAASLGTKVGGTNKWPQSSTNRLTDSASFTEYVRSTILSGHSVHASTGAANSTFFVMDDINTTEAFIYYRCPYPNCIIKNLEIYFGNGAPGVGQSYTCTLMKNGGTTAVTCTVSGNASNSAGDITHQASFTQGDQFSIRVVSSATAAVAQDIQWTLEVCQF